MAGVVRVDDQGRAVLGRFTGPGYPFGKGPAESLGPKPDVQVIFTSISNILTTQRGTYPPDPTLGSVVPELLFELNDELSRQILRDCARNDLERQEDRINVVDIRTFVDEDNDPHRIVVTISFAIIGDEAGRIFNAPITFNLAASQ